MEFAAARTLAAFAATAARATAPPITERANDPFGLYLTLQGINLPERDRPVPRPRHSPGGEGHGVSHDPVPSPVGGLDHGAAQVSHVAGREVGRCVHLHALWRLSASPLGVPGSRRHPPTDTPSPSDHSSLPSASVPVRSRSLTTRVTVGYLTSPPHSGTDGPT